MIFYEYDADGFLLGWYEADEPRPNSTAVEPPFGAASRWTPGGWVKDRTRLSAQVQVQAQAQAIAAVQRRLDAQAQAWGYDDIRSAVSYADEPADPQFQAEGRALRRWRSLTWRACWANAAARDVETFLTSLPPPPERP